MFVPRIVSALRRARLRLTPRFLRTRRMAAGARVLDLPPAQREALARNLRRMLRPETA